MTRVTVGLGDRSYEILVESGALEKAGEKLADFVTGDAVVVVTDANVAENHLEKLGRSLKAASLEIKPIILPPGETTKNWDQLSDLVDELLALGVGRRDHIVALGGGVVGDLTGFAAAILKRGCNFIQIPTTLLAQVDSSVGGKTAINTPAGKNLVGAFHQPAFVLIDPEVLDSLPPREMRAGYAEVVKYGLIDDLDFFEWCETNGIALLDAERDAQIHAIAKSVAAKARIVTEDEEERSGKRALLNLGHTFGHALEAEARFGSALLHGEAVAAGIALAFRYSVRRGHCEEAAAVRVADHFRGVDLPYDLPSAGVDAAGKTLVGHMMHDKKMEGGTLPFLLARGIGQTYLARDVDLSDVADFLDEERG